MVSANLEDYSGQLYITGRHSLTFTTNPGEYSYVIGQQPSLTCTANPSDCSYYFDRGAGELELLKKEYATLLSHYEKLKQEYNCMAIIAGESISKEMHWEMIERLKKKREPENA